MQQDVEARLNAHDYTMPVIAMRHDVAHLISRGAGPLLLAIAYGALAMWWF